MIWGIREETTEMALNTKQERIFLESDLFSGCDTRKFRALAQTLSPVSILKGQLLPSLHGAAALGFVMDGTLDFCGYNGVLFCTMEPGDFFEFHPVFSEIHPVLPYRCMVTFINKHTLITLMQDNPTVAQNYMTILSDWLQNTICRLYHFTASTPGVALGMYLLRNEKHGGVRLTDGLAGLARRLNISRATLYRCLAELEARNLIEHQEKTIYIRKKEELEQYIWDYSVPEEEAFAASAQKKEKEKRRS